MHGLGSTNGFSWVFMWFSVGLKLQNHCAASVTALLEIGRSQRHLDAFAHGLATSQGTGLELDWDHFLCAAIPARALLR